MEKLKKLIRAIDFSAPYNSQGHRDIYDHIENHCQPSASKNIAPSVVFYAARNILSPSFILGQIPELLNFVTSIEIFRRFAVLKSDEALEWQTFYELEKTHGRSQDVRLLAANEVRTLRRFLDKKDAQRREYIVLVRSLILLYIHYLWAAPESCLLPQKLHDIFPDSLQSTKKSELLFHVDLSNNEKAYFGQLKTESSEWMTMVAEWDTKREQSCREEGMSDVEIEANFVNEYHATFPPPYEPSAIARNVEIYMKKVEDMIRILEDWFPTPKA